MNIADSFTRSCLILLIGFTLALGNFLSSYPPCPTNCINNTLVQMKINVASLAPPAINAMLCSNDAFQSKIARCTFQECGEDALATVTKIAYNTCQDTSTPLTVTQPGFIKAGNLDNEPPDNNGGSIINNGPCSGNSGTQNKITCGALQNGGSKSNGLSPGVIAGIVIPAVTILIIAPGGYLACREIQKKHKRNADPAPAAFDV